MDTNWWVLPPIDTYKSFILLRHLIFCNAIKISIISFIICVFCRARVFWKRVHYVSLTQWRFPVASCNLNIKSKDWLIGKNVYLESPSWKGANNHPHPIKGLTPTTTTNPKKGLMYPPPWKESNAPSNPEKGPCR